MRERERKTKNELKQSLTLITQARMGIERRGFFTDSFFLSFDFSSFDPPPRQSALTNLAYGSSVDEKKNEGRRKPAQINRYSREEVDFEFLVEKSWRTWLAKVVSNEALPRGGEPLLRETDISPRGESNFRVEEKSVSSLAKFS